NNLSPLLIQKPVGTNLVNWGVPPLRFKLTLFGGGTCIGVSWHHTLGSLLHFISSTRVQY
ncbi:hypothetical protein BU15DRAFT_46440, partial [Melanogaster broomeanus]